MKRSFNISDIIYRSLNGEVTDRERIMLDRWLEEDPGHRDMYDKMTSGDFMREQVESHALFEVEKGYRRFVNYRNRLKRRKAITRWSAAAAVILLAGTGVWVANMEKTEIIAGSVIESTVPGKPGATLYLATGEAVILDGSLSTTLKQDNVSITVSGDRIIYEGDVTQAGEQFINTIVTARGDEYCLTFADGTVAWLSAQTRIEYPVPFNEFSREVRINGEAYFEVAPDADRPFIVNAGNMKLEVLGTSFNIRAYDDQPQQATLITGSVRASVGNDRKILVPGDRLTRIGDGFEMSRVSTEAYKVWGTTRFIFQDDHLADVMTALERWYDIPIVIENSALRDLRFTGNLPKYDNMKDVLRKLELTTRISFEEKEGRIMVVGDN